MPNRFHHGALGVCRTLGRLGVPVYANDEVPGAPASRSRYRTGSLVWRPWPGSPAEMVDQLTAWGRAQDERALLIPVDDAATVVVEEHADELAEWFRFPRRPDELVRRLSSKWTMAELATQHGLPTARVARVADLGELDSVLQDLGLPVVVKRIEGWTQGSRGVPSVSLARTRGRVRELLEAQPENLLLQEYIPGASSATWMFNGYFDRASRCLFGAMGYKIRQYPVSGGFTTLGRLEPREELEGPVRQFLEAVGYRGIVDLDLRLDVRDGQYKLLDLNPRVGSMFRLFVDTAGDDVVRVCYADLVDGNAEPRTATFPRRRRVAGPHDARAGAALIRAGNLTLGSFLRSTLSADERAWQSGDDPRPFASAVFSVLRGSPAD